MSKGRAPLYSGALSPNSKEVNLFAVTSDQARYPGSAKISSPRLFRRVKLGVGEMQSGCESDPGTYKIPQFLRATSAKNQHTALHLLDSKAFEDLSTSFPKVKLEDPM